MKFGILENFQKTGIKQSLFLFPNREKKRREATNYRLIALTSRIRKTMERMINNRLVWFLESYNLISRDQAGFHKKKKKKKKQY